jgi:deoxyribodipyrimidine photo-lyase
MHMNKFPVKYDAILELINAVDPVAYASTRNFVDGRVSRLSPYLSRGVISLPMVRDAVLQRGYTFETATKFFQELAWREYYQRIWWKSGDSIFRDFRQPMQKVAHNEMVTALTENNTRINVIDECIRGLYTKGYMHNHARMYVASLACNIARAHWRQPSEWLYYHLFDGDIASNTLSWQWVAGSFAPKKYFANQENINKYFYSNQRESYLDTTYEELARMEIPPSLTATFHQQLHTSLPEKKFPELNPDLPLFIYNSYHLDPLWRKGEDANRVLLLEPSHFARFPVSEKVLEFILKLATNIEGMQVFAGEIDELTGKFGSGNIVSLNHPLSAHYPGTKDPYPWMFPAADKVHSGFFPFWKSCLKASGF